MTVGKDRGVSDALCAQITGKSFELGLYVCNMPEDLGGGRLGAARLAVAAQSTARAERALDWAANRDATVDILAEMRAPISQAGKPG